MLSGKGSHPVDLFLSDPVLQKLGQDGFDLVDHPGTVQPFLKNSELLPAF